MNDLSEPAPDSVPPKSADVSPRPDLAPALQRAGALEVAGRIAEAERLYRSLVLAYPQQAAPLQNLALLLRERGELLEAQSLLRRALALMPGSAELHNNLGAVLHTAENRDEAEACYRRALELLPGYAEAHYNLGVLLEEAGRNPEALAAFRAAVAAQPRYARALTRIGAILSEQGAAEDALSHFDQAVAIGPKFFDAHYYRGLLLSGLQRHDEALSALEHAHFLHPDKHEINLAVGNALRDAQRYEEALNAYWRAVELRPGDSATHEQLNRLAWSTGRSDLYLRSFEYARTRIGLDPGLMLLEAAFYMRRDQYSRAEDLLWRARARAPERGDILGLLARAMAWQGKFEEAYVFFEQAVAAEPASVLHRFEFASALLRDQQAGEALQVFEQARLLDPHNQLLLSGLALSYREVGDSRYQSLVDHSRYVKVYDIKPPPGFADARAFNEALAQELDSLHTTQVEPIDQTLRGGTQTAGNLFAVADTPLIREVRNAIREAVADYARDLPQDALHPMNQRRVGLDQFDFSGSWSCRLRSQGFHTNHVHPMGWISSAYYVRLPEGIDDATHRQGWLKFGESNMALNERDRPDSFVQPEIGRLVLFPSFYWHGTMPFNDSHDRLSIAFDVVPTAGSGPGGGNVPA